jgi:hypothetical protein
MIESEGLLEPGLLEDAQGRVPFFDLEEQAAK